MKPYFKITAISGLLISLIFLSMNAQSKLGFFDGASDIGSVKFKGSCQFDTSTEIFNLKGSGKNLWYNSDEFFFVWKKCSGDFIMDTWVEFIGKGVEQHRKGGIIIRENLGPGCRYVSAAFHGDGLVSMQYRLDKDSMTKEIRASSYGLPILQLERAGSKIIMKAAENGKPMVSVGELQMDFGKDGYYVGLFICSHNVDIVEEAKFINTRFTLSAKPDFKPYQDYIGSRLEILDIETGLRKVIYQTPDAIEAPNWSKDGKFMIVNCKGLLYKISVEGGKPQLIKTDFANSNNNDHGISPDGKQLVISHHAKDRPAGENSIIYTLPIGGGVPRQVTSKSPSYWHGWSPDGKWLIYTAKRNNQWDIYKISVRGNGEIQLTDNKFLNDGSEYSTDGNKIWFNSNRTGIMHIWSMNADGSDQKQITDNETQDWFAHQSPDGKHVIFLSFPPEVDSWDHPYYKRVMLRLMDADGTNCRVVSYLYGGQGTINVPSWSPDSNKVAFVSNSNGLDEK